MPSYLTDVWKSWKLKSIQQKVINIDMLFILISGIVSLICFAWFAIANGGSNGLNMVIFSVCAFIGVFFVFGLIQYGYKKPKDRILSSLLDIGGGTLLVIFLMFIMSPMFIYITFIHSIFNIYFILYVVSIIVILIFHDTKNYIES
jgi:hypothetical protein